VWFERRSSLETEPRALIPEPKLVYRASLVLGLASVVSALGVWPYWLGPPPASLRT